MTEAAKPPRPASTILLLRDSAATKGEIEVFMMVRHYEIDFNSGALVFPGGSVDKGDQEIIANPELYSGGEGLDAADSEFPDRRDPRDLRGKRHPARASARIEGPGRCQAGRRDRSGASRRLCARARPPF